MGLPPAADASTSTATGSLGSGSTRPEFRRRGVQLPIHVGMAGVADPAKLLRVSTRIGLTDAARFLRGHSNWLMRMFQPGGYAPEKFALGLMPELGRPEMKVAGIHVFTFNEVEPTEAWRRQMLARLR